MAVRNLFLFGLSLAAGGITYQFTSQLDQSMRITLAIMVIAVILWVTEWIPLFLTSCVILFLETVFLGRWGIWEEKGTALFFGPFFNPVITLFLGGFALSLAMHKYNLDSIIAAWILHKSRGNPRRLVTLLLLSSAAVSMWISNAATTVLFMTVIIPIVKTHTGKNVSKAILLAIPIGATIGGMATPMGTPPNALAMDAIVRAGAALSFPLWFILTAPICGVLLLLANWGLEVIFPPANKDKVDRQTADRIEWGIDSAGVLVIFIVTVSLWLTTPLHHIPDGVVALVPIILLFVTRLLKPVDLKEMGWDTLLLVGGGMSLGVALKESGVAQYIVQQVAADPLPQSTAFFAMALVTLILSIFISDTVATSLTIPMIIVLGGFKVTDPVMMALASSMGMILPVSSPANAIVFSSGLVRTWDMVRIGTLFSISGILTLYVASRLYWPWILSLPLFR
jgi:sodium-dependent dicarboxylate transporter 2/3/5